MWNKMQKVSVEQLCEIYNKFLAEYERRSEILKELQKKESKENGKN